VRATRALIFDLDNTLILEDAAVTAAIRTAAELARDRAGLDAEHLATAATAAAERSWKEGPAHALADAFGIWWGEALWGAFAGEREVLRAIRAFLPEFRTRVWQDALAVVGSTDPDLALAMQQAFVDARRAGEVIDPEAESVLADLARDHRLALLTNGAGDVQRDKLARTPFALYFDPIVVSVEVDVGKPDPRIFEIALDRLGVRAGDAVMVGDSLARDVAGARAAGIRTVWIDRGQEREEGPRPDATIRRLSDLRAALDGLEQRPASPRVTT
jgi:putative hydrolase of the HAD superfamily